MRTLLRAFVLYAAVVAEPFLHAHSGGTDSQGGHNSSTGYHFHHGFSAHQHTDGLCPYIPPQPPQERTSEYYAAVRIVGKSGDVFTIEASEGNGEWQIIVPEATLPSNEEVWVDQNSNTHTKRFYRTKLIRWSLSGTGSPQELAPHRMYAGFTFNGRVGQIIDFEAREDGGEWQRVERIKLPRTGGDLIWVDERSFDKKWRYRTIVLFTPP